MMSMVVVADSDARVSTQFTLVPFKPLLTGLIIILDISGKLLSLESLEKVNITVELMIRGSESTPVEPIDETVRKCVTSPLGGFATSCHTCNKSDVVHMSLS